MSRAVLWVGGATMGMVLVGALLVQAEREERREMSEHGLGKWFTLDEFTRSNTAADYAIDNRPSADHEARIAAWVKHVGDPLREWVGQPIAITSGYRSPELNRLVGGDSASQHSWGEAADIKVKPQEGDVWSAEKLAAAIIKSQVPFDQLIAYPDHLGGHCHISYTERRANRGQVLWSPAKKVYEPWKPRPWAEFV